MNRRFPWLKFLTGIVLFTLWHQLYEFFPCRAVAIVAEGEPECIFAHQKMLFYPYILLSLVDYVRLRRRATVPASFLYARLLILVSAPWLMTSIWYVPEALGIRMGPTVELVYSILISFVGVYLEIQMEEPLEATRYGTAIRILLWILIAASLILYSGFALHPPFHGLFVS